MLRRTLGVTWQSRKVALTKDSLWIGKFDGDLVLDFVPLREVSKVKTMEKRAPRQKGPMRSKSFFEVPWTGKRPMQNSQHHEHALAHPEPESLSSPEGHFLDLDDDDADQRQHHHTNRFRRTQSLKLGRARRAPYSDDAQNSDSEYEDDDPALIFAIQSIEGGKTTVFKTRNREECEKWVQEIEAAHATVLQKMEKERLAAQALWRRVRDRAEIYYNSNPFQFGIGIIIMASYVVAMFEAQV